MNFPIFLTSSRLVLAVVVAVLLLSVNVVPFRLTIATVLFVVAALTDFFDGRAARAWNQKTEIGAFLDPLADKLLVYLSFIYLTTVGGYPLWLLLVVFTRDIVTDTFRAFAVGKGHSMPANMVSKWKSLLQMVSLTLVLALGSVTEFQGVSESEAFFTVFSIANWLMIAAAVTGVIGMIQYFVQHSHVAFKSKKSRS